MPTFNGPLFSVVSNLPEWTAFFKKLIDEHKKNIGSVFNKPTVNFGLKMDNWAASSEKGGGNFFYFDAVNTGRKSFAAPKGKALAFITTSPDLNLSFGVRAAKGYDIITRGNAAVQAQLDQEVQSLFGAWANTSTDDKDVLPRNNPISRANPIITRSFTAGRIKKNFRTTRASTKFKKSGGVDRGIGIQLSIVGGSSPNPKDIPVLRSGTSPIPISPINTNQQDLENSFGARRVITSITQKGRINHAQLLKVAQVAGTQAQLKTVIGGTLRQIKGLIPNLSQGLALGNLNAQGPSSIQPNDPFWNKLIRLPNWSIISGIFLGVGKDQVVPYIQASPSRKSTLRFKAIYSGGALAALPPASGGTVRGGFVLLADPNFQTFLANIGVII
jgi:hypothetical protein